MRPISLEISGLQSFRERRVIDFGPLLRDNLFGIFGQTGSGKSTILDAMTLALFGRVERTKGSSIASAVNSSLSDCSVAFRFEIESNGRRERYLVERSYRIRKSGMKSDARLIRESDNPPTPLADKASEVADELHRIIGITADDFSRAVVLPQGAFAEFLTMGGKDRGAMLQRIFGLEGLGNRINTRLADLRRSLESSRRGFEERLLLLGEYNDEVLAAREEEFRKAESGLASSREELESAENRLTSSEELYALILDRDTLLAGEKLRDEERTRLEDLRNRLQYAERALELEGVMEKGRETEARWKAAREELERAELARREGEARLKELRRRKERVDEWRRTELPRLEKEREVLRIVADLDERIVLLERSIREREASVELSRRELAAHLQQVEEAFAEERKLKEGREELQREIREDEREIESLVVRLQTFRQLESLAGMQDEKRKRLKELGEEEKTTRARLDGNRRDIAGKKEEEKKRSDERDEAERELERKRLENGLADALHLLKEGEPCPLCGSVEHPHPHRTEEVEDLARFRERCDAAATALKETLASLNLLERDEAMLTSTLDNLKKRREEVEDELEKVVEETAKMLDGIDYDGEVGHESLRRMCDEIAVRLEEKRRGRTEAEEHLAKLEQGLNAAAGILSEGKSKESALRAGIDSNVAELEREKNERRRSAVLREDELRGAGIAVETGTVREELERRRNESARLQGEAAEVDENYTEVRERVSGAIRGYEECRRLAEREERNRNEAAAERERRLAENGFASLEVWGEARLSERERGEMRRKIEELQEKIGGEEKRLAELSRKIGGMTVSREEVEELRSHTQVAAERNEAAMIAFGEAKKTLEDCRSKHTEWKRAESESDRVEKEYLAMKRVSTFLQGNAFVNYLADERLRHICRTASVQLARLTNGRLEVDAGGSDGFIVRDFGNGGVERSASSLSGGETFLVSLSLALALSESLQMHGAPLEFFFLDEGFGTLDSDLLETVMDALDRLRADSRRAIGVISHVESLQERIPRKLIVSPATPERGSDVRVEG